MDATPAHLVGHSWGGLICLLAAIRQAQLVRSLMLQEPPVLSLFMSTRPRPTELLRLFVRRPRTALVILSFAVKTALPAEKAFRRGDDEAAMQAYALGLLGKDTWERLPEERKQQARENLNTLRAQVLGATGGKLMELFAMPAIPPEPLARIAVPTTIVWGRHDLATPLRVAEAASARYGWPLHVIEDAADDPIIDQPEAFLRGLEEGDR